MDTPQRVRLAGWCGIAGGLFYFAHALVGDASPPGSLGFSLAAAVAAVTFVLLLIGFMGIAWGSALGGRFGIVVFGAAAGGYALMISGALLMVAGVGPITDPMHAVSLVYLLGRLLAVVCTVGTGIAVLVARRWQGWTRLAPLALGVWPLLSEAGYVVLTGNTPNGMVNGMWGLWAHSWAWQPWRNYVRPARGAQAPDWRHRESDDQAPGSLPRSYRRDHATAAVRPTPS